MRGEEGETTAIWGAERYRYDGADRSPFPSTSRCPRCVNDGGAAEDNGIFSANGK